MILWENARDKELEILADIQLNHQIVQVYDVKWSDEYFTQNLTRFYGVNLPSGAAKEGHCGNGRFLLITFIDNEPAYECVMTSRGSEYVNKNVFELKTRYRNWTGGGHKIHGTNSPKEFEDDLLLLLGERAEEYLDKRSEWDSSIIKLEKDLIGGGKKGWNSLKEMFAMMNESLKYVVLRNFEVLPDEFYSDLHGDIDFLVEDLDRTVSLLGCKKVFDEEHRVHYTVRVDHEDVYVDLRYLGDDYYDEAWEREILDSAVLVNSSFYAPCDKQHYYSLAYHVFFHKTHISPDYYGKLLATCGELVVNSMDDTYRYLTAFLEDGGYAYTKPIDKSVFYDERYLPDLNLLSEFRLLKFLDVSAYLVDQWKNGSGFSYFIARDCNGQELFIKFGRFSGAAEREYLVAQKMRKIKNFPTPKPLFCRFIKNVEFVAFEKSESSLNLDELDYSSLKESQLKVILESLVSIVKDLNEANIVHRDIRPANFLVSDSYGLSLIDFQFAVDYERLEFPELNFVRAEPEIIGGLGAEYAKGSYRWDDSHSALLIFDEISKFLTTDFQLLRDELQGMEGNMELFGLESTAEEKENWIRRDSEKHSKKSKKKINNQMSLFRNKLMYCLTRKERYIERINNYKSGR